MKVTYATICGGTRKLIDMTWDVFLLNAVTSIKLARLFFYFPKAGFFVTTRCQEMMMMMMMMIEFDSYHTTRVVWHTGCHLFHTQMQCPSHARSEAHTHSLVSRISQHSFTTSNNKPRRLFPSDRKYDGPVTGRKGVHVHGVLLRSATACVFSWLLRYYGTAH